jgi:hypothetical protein
LVCSTGLPDGLLANQKTEFGQILEVLAMENLCIFYDHLVYFTAIVTILQPFGIFCGNLVYFSPFWYIFHPFGIFFTLLVYFSPFWYIFHPFTLLVYFSPFWYIFHSFGIFFTLLVFWTKKNLATLLLYYIHIQNGQKVYQTIY